MEPARFACVRALASALFELSTDRKGEHSIMENRNEHGDVRKHPIRSTAENQDKKPYHPPRLVDYGDLTRLTAGGGGDKGDGGGGAQTMA